MSRAALYLRVSTERQAERFGLASQYEALKRRAAERGYTLAPDGDRDAFVDDGYSGGDLDRPALSRLREAVQQARVDVVLCYDPDRLARNLKDQLLLADEFERAGVRLEFITQEVDASPEGKLFFAIRGAVAEFEKEKIRQRTYRGRLQKARQGRIVNPRQLPCWLVYEPNSGQVSLHPEWALLVRQAFELVEAGWTLQAVARRFTELGYPTPTGGTHWQVATLSYWLRNPVAKGLYFQLRYEHTEPDKRRKPAGRNRKTSKRLRPPDQWEVVQVPAVVSSELWDRVQKRLAQNKQRAARNARRPYLLRSLLRCGVCGHHLAGSTSRGRWRRYRCTRYRPSRADVHGSFCAAPPIPAESLEQAVWQAVTRLLQEPELLREELRRRREQGSPSRELLEQELLQARRRLQEIPKEQDRLVEGYGKGLIPDDRMRVRMQALQQEKQALEERVWRAEQDLKRLTLTEAEEEQVLAFAERIRSGLERLDFAGRQRLLQLLVEEIVCYPDRAVVRTILPVGADGDDARLYLTPLGLIRSRGHLHTWGGAPTRRVSRATNPTPVPAGVSRRGRAARTHLRQDAEGDRRGPRGLHRIPAQMGAVGPD